ncbi:MAG: PBP1A family penicillin-binding protein, partial [candidate division NC10 bacterium]|nr:PBP1A family penicillin-binding protein [candidate division NC10 bacterium]
MPSIENGYRPGGRGEGGRKRTYSLIFWSFLLIATISVGIAGGIFAALLKDLPPPEALESLEEYQPSLITYLYSDQDEPFASFFEQRRIVVPLSKIPKDLKNAILAVEDQRFYKHKGVDPRGILRAIYTNLRAGRLVEGGSTITQQLAKVLFLTPEKSLSRKVKEILLAIEIEKKYGKEKILELYFNQIYFGHGAYGAEAAAQTYFGKSVDQLNLAESAMLAGLPRAPLYYSPIIDKERAKRRRAHVLGRMVEEGFISKAEAQMAKAVPFDETAFVRTRNQAPYFVEYIRQYLEDKYGTYALYHGGLKVYTTLNLKMQKAAEEALLGGLREIDKARGYRARKTQKVNSLGLERPYSPFFRPQVGRIVEGTVLRVKDESLEVKVSAYRGEIFFGKLGWTRLTKPAQAFQVGDPLKVQILSFDDKKKTLELALEQDPEIEGAFLALDPRDGGIKAMVGGYNFGRSKFNRAIQAKRQPGSAFKPFVYLTAFDKGLTPSTIIEDSPVSYPVLIEGKKTEWSPENYDRKYGGPTTLRRGLENSINVMAVKLIEKVGVNPVIKTAQQMGIQSELRPEYALALGVSEVSPLELVSAYGVLANRGIRFEPYTIRKVTDNKGEVLEEQFPEGHQVIREEAAFVLTHVLKGVVERGTGWKARVLGRPVAAKTGTTQDATNVWFVG